MTDRTNPASLKSRPSLLGCLRWILAAQLVALAVVLGAPMPLGLPAQVAVAATTSDGIVYEQREPGTVAITGHEGAGGRVEIPAQLEGLPVTSVADGAFSLNTSITEVSVPEGVLSVGNEAFNDCVKLSSVELPASLSSIGDSAFYSCSRLESIELPYGLASIGDGAFYGCASLASIAVPGTVADWGDNVFSSCERLESVRIGEGVSRSHALLHRRFASFLRGASQLRQAHREERLQELRFVGDLRLEPCGTAQARTATGSIDSSPSPGPHASLTGTTRTIAYLAELPETEWCGGRVHIVRPNILHLMRGEVFDIDGTTVLAMGGAASHDREWREEGKSWWPEEMPNAAEMDRCRRSLDRAGWNVDYVVTHEAPADWQTPCAGSATAPSTTTNCKIS